MEKGKLKQFATKKRIAILLAGTFALYTGFGVIGSLAVKDEEKVQDIFDDSLKGATNTTQTEAYRYLESYFSGVYDSKNDMNRLDTIIEAHMNPEVYQVGMGDEKSVARDNQYDVNLSEKVKDRMMNVAKEKAMHDENGLSLTLDYQVTNELNEIDPSFSKLVYQGLSTYENTYNYVLNTQTTTLDETPNFVDYQSYLLTRVSNTVEKDAVKESISYITGIENAKELYPLENRDEQLARLKEQTDSIPENTSYEKQKTALAYYAGMVNGIEALSKSQGDETIYFDTLKELTKVTAEEFAHTDVTKFDANMDISLEPVLELETQKGNYQTLTNTYLSTYDRAYQELQTQKSR